MNLGQLALIENYNSLRDRVPENEIGTLLQFCHIFRSDDINLYNEFKHNCLTAGNQLVANKLIELYGKRYDIDPKVDMEKLMYLFIQNVINSGVSYHLGSSANFESIMTLGLNQSAAGIKTPERQDYEKLHQMLGEEMFNKLQPFHGEKEKSKLYYSNIPILNARYGDRPEWLKELKLNYSLLKENSEEQKIVKELLDKYEEKYKDATKVLFIIPCPTTIHQITEDKVEEWLIKRTPQDIISILTNNILNQKDLDTERYINSAVIIAVNLKNGKLYGMENGELVELQSNKTEHRGRH